MGEYNLIYLGAILCLISLIILIVDLKSVNGIEMKLDVIINFIIDPFTGLTTLFYIGILLMIFSII